MLSHIRNPAPCSSCSQLITGKKKSHYQKRLKFYLEFRIYYVYVVRITTESDMWMDSFSDVQHLFRNEATVINACTVQAQYKQR